MLNIYIDIFLIVLLAIVALYSFRCLEKTFLKHKLFLLLIFSTIISIFLEVLCWAFNGKPGILMHNTVFILNIVYYLLSPLTAALWLIYTYVLASNNEKGIKFLAILIFIPYLIDVVFVSNLFTNNNIFYVDSTNLFHRGAFYNIHYGSSIVYLIGAIIFVIFKHKNLSKSDLITLLIFPLSPFVGGLIQTALPNTSIIWSAITLSLIVLYVNFQNKFIVTDYVTGAYSRAYLESFIRNRISALTAYKNATPLSGIFLDVDNFKKINDEFGHIEGDTALKLVKQLIGSCLNKKELISRFAGDEFVVISSKNTESELQELISQIDEALALFNQKRTKPYNLTVSSGYHIFDKNEKMDVGEFLDVIDKKMLQNKLIKKPLI